MEESSESKFGTLLLAIAGVASRHSGDVAREVALLLCDAAELFPHDADGLVALRAKLNPISEAPAGPAPESEA